MGGLSSLADTPSAAGLSPSIVFRSEHRRRMRTTTLYRAEIVNLTVEEPWNETWLKPVAPVQS
jgi:hypothetical protein